MALTPCPYTLHFPPHSPPAPAPSSLSPASLFFCLSPAALSSAARKNVELSAAALFSPIALRVSWRTKCIRSATEEDRRSESETSPDGDRRSDDADDAVKVEDQQQGLASTDATGTSSVRVNSTSSYSDSLSLGIREPVYEVYVAIIFFPFFFLKSS